MHAVLQYTWRNQAFKEISQHMTENQRKRALYSEYLSSYMRFGGDLPFLSFREYHRALDMNRKIVRELGNGVTMSVETATFVNRQCETLLGEMLLWEDITPENPPACLPPEVHPVSLNLRSSALRSYPCTSPEACT